MQDQLCRRFLQAGATTMIQTVHGFQLHLGWNDVMSGLQTFKNWIVGGCQYVPQSEADRSALICSRCFTKRQSLGARIARKLSRKSPGSVKVNTTMRSNPCAVCKCFLRAKIHFPISTLDTDGVKQELYPDFCWLKKSGDNYRG